MDYRLTSPFRPSELSPVQREFIAPIGLKSIKPTILRPRLVVMAKKKTVIEGLNNEMNATASRNLDFAPSRRLVRSAFVEVQQQLDHCLFKMAPPGIRTEEWYEINSKELEIFCKSWLPEPGVQLKGAVCFCHGYGDTCTFFFEGIAKQIASSGYAVYAIDHPGFGLSEGLHGYVSNFDDIVDNVIEQFTTIKERPEIRGLPHFLLGQSMGGAVAIKAVLKEPQEWDGLVLVAPMCKIAEEVMPPEPVANALIMLAKVLPKAKLVPQQDLAELAFRDLKKRRLAQYNVICYNDQTRLRTAVELLKATNDIESQLEKIHSPLLILHGAADKITDPMVSKFLHKKASSIDKTLKLYEEGYHCILEGEPDERIFTVIQDIISWLDSRCSVHKEFDFTKLKVLFLGVDENKHPGNLPRTYTLTHSDITSKLTLAISQTINNSQIQGWYNKLQRDEVVAEWKKVKGKMSLHVHCHISGGHFLLDMFARLRFFIFSKELPVVLRAFVHGDGNLLNNYPELLEAMVWVYFHSNIPEFNRVECWGPLMEADSPFGGPPRATSNQEEETPSSNWSLPVSCEEACSCCFPPMSSIPWPQLPNSVEQNSEEAIQSLPQQQ